MKIKDRTPVNRNISAKQVLCIDENNHNLGLLSLSEAIRIAQSKELDLVQIVSGDSPTCRIMNYQKFKYEQEKKQKEINRKQRQNAIAVKEMAFKSNIDINDLRIKARKVQGFLDEGDKVKIGCLFKGKEGHHKEMANKTLETFLELISNYVIEHKNVEAKGISLLLIKSK